MTTKARIDAGGRIVEIETDSTAVSTGDLAARVLVIWKQTAEAGRPKTEGPAVGFQAERRGVPSASPMSMGGNGGEYIREPKADGS